MTNKRTLLMLYLFAGIIVASVSLLLWGMNQWMNVYQQFEHEEYYKIEVTSTFTTNGVTIINNKYILPCCLLAMNNDIITHSIRRYSIIRKGEYQDSILVINESDTTAFEFLTMEEYRLLHQ